MRVSFARIAAATRRAGLYYRWLVAAFVLAAVLALGDVHGTVEAQEATEAVSAEATAPGEILVKLQPGTSVETASEIGAQSVGGQVQETIPGIDVQVVAVEPGQEQAAVDAYEQDPNVVFAEVNGYYEAADHGTPNDPRAGEQWQFDNTGQTSGKANADIYAFGAWHKTSGSDTVPIAVLDSGINPAHPDLQGKVALDANFSASDTTDDVFGHGTHVAGSAASSTNDGVGVAGTCGGCSLYNVKVLGDDGRGDWAGVADGIIWSADNGAYAINLSLGGSTPSLTVEDAVNYAWSKGIVVVAAAGNRVVNRDPQAPFYPAAHENAVAVAATDHNDQLAGFSSHGADWVDVAAPGASILSTTRDGAYGMKSGTSMAAPHAAGVVGLVWSTSPAGTTSQGVRDKVETTANKIAGTGVDTAHGRINACRAVDGACDRDAAPPTADETIPAEGEAGVALDKNVAATFSEPLDAATVTNDTFFLVEKGTTTGISATVAYDFAKMQATLDPSTDLASNTAYTATLKGGESGVKDEYGNALAADTVWDFATSDTAAPAPPTIDLDAASDSGFSNYDNVTNDTTPTLTGTAEAGSTVRVYEGTTATGTMIAGSTGAWSLTTGTLVNGTHTFSARATDAAGNESAASADLAVAIDTTVPTVRAPAHAFSTPSQLGTSTVPVKLTWGGYDPGGTGLQRYELRQSSNNGYAFSNVPLSTQTTHTAQLSPGTNTYVFSVRAVDRAGNVSPWTNGSGFKVGNHPETSSSVAWVGPWTAESSTIYFGGTGKYAFLSGRTATLTFSGSKQIGWLSTRNTNRGIAKVSLYNNTNTLIASANVDTYAGSGQYRQLMWARGGLDPAKSYRLVVEPAGTKNASSAGTRVDVDGFVAIN